MSSSSPWLPSDGLVVVVTLVFGTVVLVEVGPGFSHGFVVVVTFVLGTVVLVEVGPGAGGSSNPQVQTPKPLPLSSMPPQVRTSLSRSSSDSAAGSNAVSVTWPHVWRCVAHATSDGVGVGDAGSQMPPGERVDERSFSAPVVGLSPVSGLLARSRVTESVRSPFGVTGHPQHSAISWSAVNT